MVDKIHAQLILFPSILLQALALSVVMVVVIVVVMEVVLAVFVPNWTPPFVWSMQWSYVLLNVLWIITDVSSIVGFEVTGSPVEVSEGDGNVVLAVVPNDRFTLEPLFMDIKIYIRTQPNTAYRKTIHYLYGLILHSIYTLQK